jgi:hypothetical protein
MISKTGASPTALVAGASTTSHPAPLARPPFPNQVHAPQHQQQRPLGQQQQQGDQQGNNRNRHQKKSSKGGGSGMQQQGWPFLNHWMGTVQIWPYNGPRLPTPQQPGPSQQQLRPPQQQHALHAAAFQPMFPGPVTAAGLPMPFQLGPGAFLPGMPPSAYMGPPAPGCGVPSFPLMPQLSMFQQPPAPWTPMSSTGSWDQHALANSFNT